MSFLKRIPVIYSGELHKVKLINFSVDLDEVLPMVPQQIKVRNFDGKAIISMVNVNLKHMTIKAFPDLFSLDYQHVAFRLLVDDSEWSKGKAKGIYFLKSFTNKPFVVWSGNLLSHYKLSKAKIHDVHGFDLWQSDKYIRYHLSRKRCKSDEKLKTTIQCIDRAYAVDNDKLVCTRIQREKWPIEPVSCVGFETNFFDSAKLLGAFSVNEVIHYQWLPAQPLD